MTTQKQFVCFALISVMSTLTSIVNADTPTNTVTSASTVTSPNSDSAAPAVDKSQYNLFNPTPIADMRDFSPDRPDKTDGPRTIDAGHLQLEMDLANYTDTRNTIQGNDARFQQYQIAPTELRLGVTNNSEADLVMETYNIQEIHDYTADTKRYLEGYGDTDLKYKLNLSGNDTDGFAMGLISYIKIPTNHDNLGNDSVEGGQSFTVDYPWGKFDIGAETGIDAARNVENNNFHAEFINSITIHRDIITDILNAYVEFYSDVPSNNDFPWVGTVDTGLILSITKNTEWDCGINIGVTRGAPQWNPFTGFSVRF
jgi:hypothetical protein